jgi:hypothetical protein
MKQLTIYCSSELNETVNRVLHHYELEGFIHMPEIYGNKPRPKGSYEQDLAWQANAFVIFPNDEQLRGITSELIEFANQCRVKPCLRMVVTPIEQLY